MKEAPRKLTKDNTRADRLWDYVDNSFLQSTIWKSWMEQTSLSRNRN